MPLGTPHAKEKTRAKVAWSGCNTKLSTGLVSEAARCGDLAQHQFVQTEVDLHLEIQWSSCPTS